MTDDDVEVVTATCTTTEIVVKAATAAMATTVTMTVRMRLATVTQKDRAHSQMIALPRGRLPHHLGPPLGAQVPHTMTTPGDVLPRHLHLKMTNLDGKIYRLRMAPLGVNRKTCTEGTG
jgi:hypothetical protein